MLGFLDFRGRIVKILQILAFLGYLPGMRSTILMASETGVVTGVLSLSQALENIGFTHESMLGKRLWDFVSDERDRKLIRYHFAECLLTQTDQQFEFLVRVKDYRALHQISYIRASAPGIILVRSSPIDDGGLSPEELRVVRLLIGDVSLKDIASRCRVSSSTIHTRLDRIRRKLGVKTTHGIVAAAHARGIG